VPGTLRDSLVLLAVVLEQPTELNPIEIMTDTEAYTDVVFGLFWLLGYRFSPRVADIGGARYSRMDPSADYGCLNGIARHQINTKTDRGALRRPSPVVGIAQVRYCSGHLGQSRNRGIAVKV
jgi:TnpA family transposase